VVDRITVNEGGSINVSSGASVDSASILDGGGICVSKGATVTNLDASDGAIVTLDVAPDTYVQGAYAGSAFELKDAAISDYAIHHGSLEVRKDGVARRIVNEDGGTLRIYEGAILDGVSMSNGDLYIFEGAKATGKMELNGGYIYVHGGAVIDFDLTQTTPGAEALVSDLSLVNGTPSYTLTVSGSEVDGVYRLADGAAAFDQTITVMNTTGAALGTLTVGATQEIGGVKYALELNDDGNLDLTVGDPLPNWPDNGSNNVDKLWDKKAKKPVAGGIYYTVATVLGPTTSAVQIDDAKTVKNTVEEFDGKSITYTNFTGKITGKGYDPDTDDSDCRKIELSTGARLSFDVTAKSAGKFVIYQIDEKYDAKKGPTYTLKSVQSTSISLKKNTTYSTVSTKEVYLEKGTYYLSFESTIDKKKDTENFYNVELNCKEDPKKPATKFYVDDDSGDNNWLYDKKLKKTNSAVCGAAAIEIARNKSATIQVDKPEITGSYTNFVGFGDEYDYVKVHLSTGANLVFTVEAKDTAKFTISQLTYDKKTNTVSGTKAVQSTALKLDKATGKYTLTTKAVVLTEGDYYLSVQSSNAKKGGEAYYNVSVDGASAFFDNCDNHDNDFLYDKKQGGVNTKVTGLSALELNTSLKDKNIQVDTQSIHDETGWNNFVGYDDEADYTKFHVAGAGTASFSVVSTDAAKFVIYQLAFDKKGNVTGTKAIQTVTLKQNKTTGKYEMPANTKPCEFKEAGDYYLSVQSTNATKGGNAYYNVTLLDTNIAPVVTDALAMPETSDALAMTDSLSFGQYDADALTDASISAIADLDGKSAWQNIAPLA